MSSTATWPLCFIPHHSCVAVSFHFMPSCPSLQVDRLLQLLVEEMTAAEAARQPLPLTIVFVERKVLCTVVGMWVEQGGARGGW